MNIPSQEPVNNSSDPIPNSPSAQLRQLNSCAEDTTTLRPRKRGVKYMECLKNHAAAIGGHATDGCGEFMRGGAEGSIEALKCSACNCHRNFHRKILDGDHQPILCGADSQCHHLRSFVSSFKAEESEGKLVQKKNELQTWESEEPNEGGRKRCRTRFSQEQKEKMLSFAEKVGWKIQKVDDHFVHGFCQDIGIKKSVLKVWMHNNKHSLAKKSVSPT